MRAGFCRRCRSAASRLHDAFLQLGGYVGQPLQRHLDSVSSLRREISTADCGSEPSSHHRHQMSKRIDVARIDWLRPCRLMHFVGGDRLTAGLAAAAWRRAWLPSPPALSLWRAGCGAVRVPAATGAVGGATTSIAVSRNARSSSSRYFAGDATAAPAPGHQAALRHRARRPRRLGRRRCGLRPRTLSSLPFHAPLACNSSIRSWSEPSAPLGRLELAQDSLMRSIVVRISVPPAGHPGMPSRNLPIRVSPACAALPARQPEEAARCPLGCGPGENVIEYLGVARFLLERTAGCRRYPGSRWFPSEFPQRSSMKHPRTHGRATSNAFRTRSALRKAFNIG